MPLISSQYVLLFVIGMSFERALNGFGTSPDQHLDHLATYFRPSRFIVKISNMYKLKVLTYNPYKFAFRSFFQKITNRIVLPSVVKVKKWNQDDVIQYLQSVKGELGLKDKSIDIIKEQAVSGPELLELTGEKLERWGMPGGPAMRIAKAQYTIEIVFRL